MVKIYKNQPIKQKLKKLKIYVFNNKSFKIKQILYSFQSMISIYIYQFDSSNKKLQYKKENNIEKQEYLTPSYMDTAKERKLRQTTISAYNPDRFIFRIQYILFVMMIQIYNLNNPQLQNYHVFNILQSSPTQLRRIRDEASCTLVTFAEKG